MRRSPRRSSMLVSAKMCAAGGDRWPPRCSTALTGRSGQLAGAANRSTASTQPGRVGMQACETSSRRAGAGPRSVGAAARHRPGCCRTMPEPTPESRARSGLPRARGDHLVDRVRAHRRADRLPEQVDQQEIRLGCRGNAHARTCSRRQPAAPGSRAVPPAAGGTWPTPVRIVPAHHTQVRRRYPAAEQTRVDQKTHVRALQPDQFAAAQPGPRHQQHDQPVPRRPAGPQQRRPLGVAGPVHHRLRPRAGAAPEPPGEPLVLTAWPAPERYGRRPARTATTSARAAPARPRPRARRIPHRGQHALIRRGPRTGSAPGRPAPAHPRRPRRRLTCGPACRSHVMATQRRYTVMPVPVGERTTEEQCEPAAYDLVVNSEPSRPNWTCRKNGSASSTTARSSSSTCPIPHPGRQPHRKRLHPDLSRDRHLYDYQRLSTTTGRSVANRSVSRIYATSHNNPADPRDSFWCCIA